MFFTIAQPAPGGLRGEAATVLAWAGGRTYVPRRSRRRRPDGARRAKADEELAPGACKETFDRRRTTSAASAVRFFDAAARKTSYAGQRAWATLLMLCSATFDDTS